MDTRFRIAIILLAGLLAALVWVLPYWWPLVNPGGVAEGLPGLELDERAQYAALSNAEKNLYTAIYEGDTNSGMEGNPGWALGLVRANLFQEDQFAAEGTETFEPPVGSQVAVTGELVGLDAVRKAAGNIIIFLNPDGTRLLRFEPDFSSTRAPNIHIILTRNPDPTDERGVGVDYIDIGALRGNVGLQNYGVPASADFDRYPVLALYAPDYDAVLATATLR